ncbi:class I SAM-dependent methyltransferase [Nevskia sp.]|uniref:class I SAM-dependent methyltransferase n=1 Tax=Nevskia sp. TaxID=1929292 RepID=UPI00345994C0
MNPALASHVPESRFGVWFLGTETWIQHVLERALDNLETLIPARRTSYPVVVDVGCGWGHSFQRLQQRFAPERLIGVDVAPEMLAASVETAMRAGLDVELLLGNDRRLPLPDQSADLLLCHQTFHHLVHQHEALAEFHRVLKPGGVLLFSESTRRYIHSWIIRLLFRHPMDVQRTAPEYLAMIRDSGFEVAPSAVSYPFLWWSRPDLGIVERLFGRKPSATREETLINVVGLRR